MLKVAHSLGRLINKSSQTHQHSGFELRLACLPEDMVISVSTSGSPRRYFHMRTLQQSASTKLNMGLIFTQVWAAAAAFHLL